jgi:hypothetical protein
MTVLAWMLQLQGERGRRVSNDILESSLEGAHHGFIIILFLQRSGYCVFFGPV